MKGLKTVFICSECQHQTIKWLGKCPSCGKWNTFVEDVIDTRPEETSTNTKRRSPMSASKGSNAISYNDLEIPDYIRSKTGLNELDRVLGGGLVHGSVVLISGEPGIGKSTLLMQISDALGQSKRFFTFRARNRADSSSSVLRDSVFSVTTSTF